MRATRAVGPGALHAQLQQRVLDQHLQTGARRLDVRIQRANRSRRRGRRLRFPFSGRQVEGLRRQDRFPRHFARDHDLGRRAARDNRAHPGLLHRARADLPSAGRGQDGRDARPYRQGAMGPQRGQRMERARVRDDGNRGPAAHRTLRAHRGLYRNHQGAMDLRARHLQPRIEMVPDSRRMGDAAADPQTASANRQRRRVGGGARVGRAALRLGLYRSAIAGSERRR